jgi:hypothetical protein
LCVDQRIAPLTRIENRAILYCVDDRAADRVKGASCRPHPSGVITWNELGGLQIQLARGLDLPDPYRGFIAGAIQYQYCEHGIRPTVLASDYLEDEHSMADVDAKGVASPNIGAELWRLA